MAIVDKPEFDEDEVIALEDSADESEDLEYSAFVAEIRSKYQRSKDRRLTDEDRWLTAYKNYRGVYDDTTQFTETERSQIFVKITKTKGLDISSGVEISKGIKDPVLIRNFITKCRNING